MLHQHRDNSADKPALIALIGISIIFFAIVGYGWTRMFLSWEIPVLPYLAGYLLALIAIGLAYAAAHERSEDPESKSVFAAYFFILFLLSALGTINSLFVNFSGVIFMREGLESAQTTFSELKNEAPVLLATKELEKFENKVDDTMKLLEAEIRNPMLCGQGPVATALIVELIQQLPNFRKLAGAGCAPDKINLLLKSYKDTVEKLKQTSEKRVAAAPSLEALKAINLISDQSLENLSIAVKNLNGVSDIYSAKKILMETQLGYADALQKLRTVYKGPDKLKTRIDTRSVEWIGNIGQLVNMIFSRLNDMATYAYITIAFLLDIILVIAFFRVLRKTKIIKNRQTVYL